MHGQLCSLSRLAECPPNRFEGGNAAPASALARSCPSGQICYHPARARDHPAPRAPPTRVQLRAVSWPCMVSVTRATVPLMGEHAPSCDARHAPPRAPTRGGTWNACFSCRRPRVLVHSCCAAGGRIELLRWEGLRDVLAPCAPQGATAPRGLRSGHALRSSASCAGSMSACALLCACFSS